MIKEYHNHKSQTTPWHREEEPSNHHETPGRPLDLGQFPIQSAQFLTACG